MFSFRTIGLLFVGWLFRLLLFGTAVSSALVLTFGTPHTIKNALIETGAYERFVPSVINTNVKQDKQQGSLPLEKKEIQLLILQAFPAQELRAQAEMVIDSSYRWLSGQSPMPDFVVNFDPNVTILADRLSTYAFDQLAYLPPCIEQPLTLDPFNATCRPETINTSLEQANFARSIKRSGSILPKTVLTAADLPKNEQGQTIIQQFPQAPNWFSWLKLAPWLLGLLTILTGVVLIWLSRIKRAAMRDLGKSILSNGIFLCISPLVFGFIIPKYTTNVQSSFGASDAQDVMADISQAINGELNIWLLLAGVMIIIVGAAGVLLERATRPRVKYGDVKKRSGLISAIEKRAQNGRFKLRSAIVPLQSSETSVTKRPKVKKDKKYRKISKKELSG